jgi:hypothetical protein
MSDDYPQTEEPVNGGRNPRKDGGWGVCGGDEARRRCRGGGSGALSGRR